MTTPDRSPENRPNIFRAFFGKFSLNIPKIRPHIEKEADGSVTFDIDLNHKDTPEALDQLAEELNRPRLKVFMDEVLDGHKKAWYTVVFGGVSIIVGSAAVGAELGVRHGKDIHRLLSILEEHKKNKTK